MRDNKASTFLESNGEKKEEQGIVISQLPFSPSPQFPPLSNSFSIRLMSDSYGPVSSRQQHRFADAVSRHQRREKERREGKHRFYQKQPIGAISVC